MGPGLGTIEPEGGSHDASCQQQCPCGRKLPNMATDSIYVPRVSYSHPLPLQATLQDQQLDLAQAPVKLLLLPWVPVHMGFCVGL